MDVDAALSEVPVNIMPLLDDGDFKTREESVVYNQSGLDLVWNFVTTAGAMTQTAVTPTEAAGNYDWSNQGNGMYAIEIPASGGASINNDTEGFGWFTGFATGILPWRGPVIGFRAGGLNDKLIDSAYSATRGLAGTALPDAAADAAGGLPISDAGGLDLDAQIGTDIDAILADTGTDGVVVASIANGAITAAAIATGAIDADAIADGAIDAGAIAADAITAAKIAAGAIDAATFAADVDAEILSYIVDDATRIDASDLNTEIDALKDGGRLDLLVDAIKAKTDSLTFTVANQVDANALTLDEDEILDDALADSVPADGALPTVRQALYMIVQFLTERSVSSTTVTVNKVDGTTALMTFTLDSATAPTSITRAT